MRERSALLLFIAYAALIVYGSLYPFSGWRPPSMDLFDPSLWQHGRISRSDLLVNSVVYVPLGLLGGYLFSLRLPRIAALFAVVFLGGVLSFSLELSQAFLPDRVTSLVDLMLNCGGTAAGGVMAGMLRRADSPGAALQRLRAGLLRSGPDVNAGLTVLLLWTMAQLSPFVPTLDIGDLRAGLRPLWHVIRDPGLFRIEKALVHGLDLFGLGMTVFAMARVWGRVFGFFAAFTLAVFLSKVFVMDRQLSAEALAGGAVAICALAVVMIIPRIPFSFLGVVALVAGFCISELSAAAGPPKISDTMNFIPFRNHMNGMGGLTNILEIFWRFMAIGYLFRLSRPGTGRPWALAGGFAVFLLVFFLERAQMNIPGRTADVTDALLAAAAWGAVMLFRFDATEEHPSC